MNTPGLEIYNDTLGEIVDTVDGLVVSFINVSNGRCGSVHTSSSDLVAVRVFHETRIGPIIDSVFKPQEAVAFLVGSFFDPGRFGKCVMTLTSVNPGAVTTPRTKALATATV